jgi:hypothetical protein
MVDSSDNMRRVRTVASLAAYAMLILGLGCVPPHPPPGPGGPPLVGGLNATLEANATETKAYVESLKWKSPTRVLLPCKATDGCGASGQILLDFYLHPGSTSISIWNVVKEMGAGHIVAKIVNTSAFSYNEYGLGSKDSVFLWVGKITRTDANGESLRSFATFHINAAGAATGLRRARRGRFCSMVRDPDVPAVHELPYPGYVCNYPDVVYNHPAVAAGRAPDSFLRLTSYDGGFERNARTFADGDLWFSCSGGCCQADSWSFY